MLQRHDRRAGGDELTEIDLAHTQPPGERCANDLFRHECLLPRDLSAGDLQVRGIGVDGRLRHAMHGQLLLVALQVHRGEVGAGLQLRQFRLVVIRPQPQQHGSRRHGLAGLEIDLIDDAADLGRQVGAVRGARGADRGLPRLPRLHRGGRRGDRRLLRADVRHDLLQDAGLELLEPDQAAGDQTRPAAASPSRATRSAAAAVVVRGARREIVHGITPQDCATLAHRYGSTSRRPTPETARRCR